jgi:hypothetical protein
MHLSFTCTNLRNLSPPEPEFLAQTVSVRWPFQLPISLELSGGRLVRVFVR